MSIIFGYCCIFAVVFCYNMNVIDKLKSLVGVQELILKSSVKDCR